MGWQKVKSVYLESVDSLVRLDDSLPLKKPHEERSERID